jgi:hypothetical protein
MEENGGKSVGEETLAGKVSKAVKEGIDNTASS